MLRDYASYCTMNPMADQEDIRKVLQGQTHAYAAIVDRHKDMVFSICMQVIRQREEAEEAAQDVFMKAYQTLAGFRGQSRFSTWIYRIAVNTAISRTRKRSMRWLPLDENRQEDFALPEAEMLEEAWDQETRLRLTKEALEKLPEGDRLLLMLFYYEDLSMEEISHITGLTVSNTKVRLHRLRKKLQESLNDRIFVTEEEGIA